MFVASVEAIGRAARRLCSRSRLQRRFCAPPDAYDARDKLHGQLQSDSFNALNQGDCDSRYAFGCHDVRPSPVPAQPRLAGQSRHLGPAACYMRRGANEPCSERSSRLSPWRARVTPTRRPAAPHWPVRWPHLRNATSRRSGRPDARGPAVDANRGAARGARDACLRRER